jgi:hypothetical protein
MAYYFNKKVQLVRKEYRYDEDIELKQGDPVRTNIDLHEVLTFKPKIKGELTIDQFIQAEFINYRLFAVEFEDDTNEDCKLYFAVDLRDPNGRFVLQYDNEDDPAFDGSVEEGRMVIYRGEEYYVRYEGDERPYLNSKVTRTLVKDRKDATISGKVFE